MAVTIESNPQAYTPSDNPIIWEFSSDQTTQSNFSYIVEVYVDGVLDSNHQIFPEDGIYAHFDAQEKMKAQVPAPVIGQTGIVTDAQNNREIYIKVFERYGTPAVNQASATSDTITAWKACISNEEMEVFDYLNYTAVAAGKPFFLTDLTESISIRPDADYYLSIITDNILNMDIELTFKDSTGAVITTIGDPFPGDYKISLIRLNLENLVTQTALTTPQANSTETIDVVLKVGAVQYSSVKTYSINRDCNYFGRHLIWLNHLGGYDQFTFIHNGIETTRTESKSYQKQFGGWNAGSFVLDASNSGEIGYLITSRDSIELVSDWITESVQNWLVGSVFEGVKMQLQIDLEDYSGVKMITSSYRKENDHFEELINVICSLRLSNFRNSPKV